MNNQPKRSSFINTFAWITIVFSGFSIVIGIMQSMIIMRVIKDIGLKEMSQNIPDDMPPMMAIIFGNMELIIIGTLVLTIITFISAIALLKRKNWARLFFIVLLLVGILWNVIGGYMQFDMMGSMMFAGEEIPAEMQSIQSTMKIVMGAIIVAILALHIYFIKRLSSDEIKGEFLGLVK